MQGPYFMKMIYCPSEQSGVDNPLMASWWYYWEAGTYHHIFAKESIYN